MRKDLCILLSTCPRYAPVARLTQAEIARQWNPAPPVFLCGVEATDALPMREDTADWMAVTLEAVRALAERGYRWVYLILDDHPPVGRCGAPWLNETLPVWAEEHRAAIIGLLGWGQRRPRDGQDLGSAFGHLVRNDRGYRWKFSLHPALWSVEALIRLLEIRMVQFGPGQRTPWNFERHRDAADGPVPGAMLDATYRVHGSSLVPAAERVLNGGKEAALFGFDVWRFFLRVGLGQGTRDEFDREGLWLYHWYFGPYPIFWSGAIRGGRMHPEFQTFQRLLARRWMAPEWVSLERIFPPAR